VAASRILSETSGLEPSQEDGSTGDDEVYLTLRFGYALFLSTSPTYPPYAFVRLQDAAVREISEKDRQLVLGGKLRKLWRQDINNQGMHQASSRDASPRSTGRTDHSSTSMGSEQPLSPSARGLAPPFGADIRKPLPLCFLLADGRFQPFEAVWLELHFKTGEDFQMWHDELKLGTEKYLDTRIYGPKGPGAVMISGTGLQPPPLPAEEEPDPSSPTLDMHQLRAQIREQERQMRGPRLGDRSPIGAGARDREDPGCTMPVPHASSVICPPQPSDLSGPDMHQPIVDLAEEEEPDSWEPPRPPG